MVGDYVHSADELSLEAGIRVNTAAMHCTTTPESKRAAFRLLAELHADVNYLSEAQLAAEFYMAARVAGLDVRLEVPMPSDVHCSGEMRADAAVLVGTRIVCCVEVKNGALPQWGTRQAQAYAFLEREHGIRTLWLNDIAGIPALIAAIQRLIAEG